MTTTPDPNVPTTPATPPPTVPAPDPNVPAPDPNVPAPDPNVPTPDENGEEGEKYDGGEIPPAEPQPNSDEDIA
jgi:hypothetical protein